MWEDSLTRRQRECAACGQRFQTYEVPAALIRTNGIKAYNRGIQDRALALHRRNFVARRPTLSSGVLGRLLKVPPVTVRAIRRALKKGNV